ncbi:hypothetical protein RhiirA4_530704 [Rhizophagus irregularis]|uniref:Uncharacterized protein n=1 Tax=Rhizophagus irregularis TaxID=588596 RepID=A0A2I1G0I8_9GLOM|nr:hypothetical protein RhiirA4_530704 [Rhizophagus irregularis]
MPQDLETKLKLKTEAYNALLESYKVLQLRVERQINLSSSDDAEHVRMTTTERRKLIETNRKLKEKVSELEIENQAPQVAIRTARELHERQYERQKAEIIEQKDQIINNLKEKIQQFSNLISPNQPYDFQSLQTEIKRLKIQDLTIQIPLKKQEFEQNTNNLKNNLNNSGKYLLDKIIKKQNKLFQSNKNNSDKLEELKQILKDDLKNNSERLTEVLNENKELFNLKKHLKNLQNEQNIR